MFTHYSDFVETVTELKYLSLTSETENVFKNRCSKV